MNHANHLRKFDRKDLGSHSSHLAPSVDWSDMRKDEHFVQFYEDDAFLIDSVAAFAGAGLGANEGVLVIATPAHRNSIEAQLQKHGFHVPAARTGGQYIALDARETLSKFMVNDSPDAKLFMSTVGDIVAQTIRSHGGVRAFGEMVALLCEDGNALAAIRLETLWNDLIKAHSFSLFCAYPITVFRGETEGGSFAHICKEHSRVIPSESYAGEANADERLRSITLLQQKASSLEAEILDRKHAESVAHAEQTKLSMAVAVAGLGIWELDMDTNLLTCSNECKAQFGLASTETLSFEHFFELIHPDDRESVRGALRKAVADGSDYNAEYRLVGSSGGLRWVASMGRCVHNGAHRLLGVIQDITDRKRAAEILEQTVAERTNKLQETIGELEAFSYSISHDMRSPLRAMHAYAKALLQDYGTKLDSEAINSLERIERVSTRLDLLIRDVLAYSKVAKGQIELKAIALGPLIEDIICQHPEFETRKSCFNVIQPLHAVLGHEAYLTQCITNLMDNALKFVAPGTIPQVRIRSEAIGDKVRVWVSDNGLGIEARHYERIFRIFGRVYSEKVYPGTGIGLAIVKKAVARMGGETGFQSELGKGTDFWFILPNGSDPH